jgi:hypothetical protein
MKIWLLHFFCLGGSPCWTIESIVAPRLKLIETIVKLQTEKVQEHHQANVQIKKVSNAIWETLKHILILEKIEEEETFDSNPEFFLTLP